jgi:hypothetical protein
MDFVTRQHVARLVHGMKECKFKLYFEGIVAQVFIGCDGNLTMTGRDFLECFNGQERSFRFALAPPCDVHIFIATPISKLHDSLFAALDKEENPEKQRLAVELWDDFVAVLKDELVDFFREKYQRKLQMKIQRLESKKRKLDKLLGPGGDGFGRDLYCNVKRFRPDE